MFKRDAGLRSQKFSLSASQKSYSQSYKYARGSDMSSRIILLIPQLSRTSNIISSCLFIPHTTHRLAPVQQAARISSVNYFYRPYQTFPHISGLRNSSAMASLKTATTFDKNTKVALKGLNGDVEVPPVCCGTWSWGDSRQWGYKEERDLPAIREVWTQNNNEKLSFYDGAEVYGLGENERIIGRLIKETPEEQKKDLIIATKWIPSPVFPGRLFPSGMVSALKKSLARLGLEQVDLYQIHIPMFWVYSIESMARQLAECVKLGLTKTVGVSNFSKEHMIKMYDELKKYDVPLASNQIEYNLLRTLPEKTGLLAACLERDIVPLAYSPLAMGRLTGKYNSKNPIPSNRQFGDQPWEKVEPLLEVMKEIGDKYNVPISAIALNWVMCKGAIPLGGARNGKQAEQNAKSLGFKLTADEVTRLDGLSCEGKMTSIQGA